MIKHYTFYQWFSLAPVPLIIFFYRVVVSLFFTPLLDNHMEWLMGPLALLFMVVPSLYLVIASIYFLRQGKPKGVCILILMLNSLWLLFFGGVMFAVVFLGWRA